MIYNSQPTLSRRTAPDALSRRRMLALALTGGGVLAAGGALAWTKIGLGDPVAPAVAAVPRSRTVRYVADVTDVPSANQLQAFSTDLDARLGKLAVGDVINIDLLVPSEGGPLNPLFSGAKPKPGTQANPVVENARLMQHDYDEFIGKAKAALGAVAAVKQGAWTSSIVEAIWVEAKRGPLDEIVLWSDMVNKSGTINHFAKTYPKFGNDITRKLALTGLENLKGATVTINQLALNTAHQTERLRQWWDAYWKYVGVSNVTWTLVPA
jgi:hypothetical protein